MTHLSMLLYPLWRGLRTHSWMTLLQTISSMIPKSVIGAIALMWLIQMMTWIRTSKLLTWTSPLLFSHPPLRRSFVLMMTVVKNSSWTRALQCTFMTCTTACSSVITATRTFEEVQTRNCWQFTWRCAQSHALTCSAASGTLYTTALDPPNS